MMSFMQALLNLDTCMNNLHEKEKSIQYFPESFKCFEYPAIFTIFAKDSDIRKIHLW